MMALLFLLVSTFAGRAARHCTTRLAEAKKKGQLACKNGGIYMTQAMTSLPYHWLFFIVLQNLLKCRKLGQAR